MHSAYGGSNLRPQIHSSCTHAMFGPNGIKYHALRTAHVCVTNGTRAPSGWLYTSTCPCTGQAELWRELCSSNEILHIVHVSYNISAVNNIWKQMGKEAKKSQTKKVAKRNAPKLGMIIFPKPVPAQGTQSYGKPCRFQRDTFMSRKHQSLTQAIWTGGLFF